MRYRLGLLSAVVGLVTLTPSMVMAQTTNTVNVPNNATSTANPQSSLDQQGSLVNTQVNTHPLGRSIVGNGIADCTSSGISASAFGSGVGPFDTGSIGGSITYTHSFGMGTCKQYAKTQLGRAKLETCLLLISNYSKMLKSGVEVSYDDLMAVANVDCPAVTVQRPAFSASPRSQKVGTASQPSGQNEYGPSLPPGRPVRSTTQAQDRLVPSAQAERAEQQAPIPHEPQALENQSANETDVAASADDGLQPASGNHNQPSEPQQNTAALLGPELPPAKL